MLYEGGPEARPESGRNIGRECEDDKHRFRRRTREAPVPRLNHSAGRTGPGEAPHWTLPNAVYIEESLSFPQQLCRNGTMRPRRDGDICRVMDADWITSPSARRVQQHAGDSRPAWLWSQDGQLLLWHDDAAPLFLAKLKKHGLKRAAPAVPSKGEIARNIRLGSLGRTSLARIQFTAAQKPASATCATTPLPWQEGQTALLIVGVEPIAADILDAARTEAEAAEPVLVGPGSALETDAWEDAEPAP